MDNLVKDPKRVEEVLNAVLNNTTDNIVYLSVDYKVKAFNNVIYQTLLIHRGKEIKIGDDYREFLTKENEETFYRQFKAALKGVAKTIEFEIIRGESGNIWFEYKINPVYENENIIGLTITGKNINEQKLAQRNLQEKLSILDAVFNSATDALLLFDLEYNVLKFNNVFSKTLEGLSGHKIKIGENFLKTFVTKKTLDVFIPLAERAKLGEQIEIEYFTESKLSSKWLFYKISPVYDVNKNIIAILMTVQDIDNHKKSEIRLQNSEEKFRKIVQSAAHPIIIIDLSMNIILVNSETELVFGYSKEELLGKPISLLIPERFHKNHTQYQADYLKNPLQIRMGHNRITPAKHKFGNEIIIEASLSSFSLNDESHVLIILQDVTQRINADNKIKAQFEQLRKIAWEQAHEVRRPVTNILGLISLLSDENNIDMQKETLNYIKESAEQLDSIIHKIVDYTKGNPL